VPILVYLIQSVPTIIACTYGLVLAFKNWPINHRAGKLVISAFMIELAGICWGLLQWSLISPQAWGDFTLAQLVTFSGLARSTLEATILVLLAMAVFYGRPGAAVWPLRAP